MNGCITPAISHAGWRTVSPSERRKTSQVSVRRRMGSVVLSIVWRGAAGSGGLVAQRAAGLAEEDVVEAGPVEGERLRREALPVEDPEHEREAGLAVVDVQADGAIRAGGLADPGLGGHEPGDQVRAPVDADRHDVPGDRALELRAGALGDDPAMVDDREPVAQRVGLVEVVRREEDGGPGV